jgi:protein-S-isoprenylcysteine O-methyltransferase Ste14
MGGVEGAAFRVGAVLRSLAMMAIIAGILFVAAGRIDLPFFWAYLAVFTAFALVVMLTVPAELLEERSKPGGESRDNLALLRVVAGVVFLGQWIVAGLDVGRFHWSDTVPVWLQAAGLASFAALLATWYGCMRVNPFFSAAVRVQSERGHHVVDSGPYRLVRHPGYAAFVLLGWGGPIALGSWWAVVSHLAVVVLFVRRARMEDRILREELAGYAAYAARVRYLFVPGVF